MYIGHVVDPGHTVCDVRKKHSRDVEHSTRRIEFDYSHTLMSMFFGSAGGPLRTTVQSIIED